MTRTAATIAALLFMLGSVISARASVIVLSTSRDAEHAQAVCKLSLEWYMEDRKLIDRYGCDQIAGCRENMPVVEACRFDELGGWRDFQEQLLTKFAIEPACKGVRIVRFKKENPLDVDINENWLLIIDFMPGSQKHRWTMNRGGAWPQGEGTEQEIAAETCSIANGVGAEIGR